jgi:hypothetical protein
MLKLTVMIGHDILAIDGDVSILEVLPVITAWLEARGTDTHGVIDRLVADAAKIDQASDALGEVSTQLDAGSPAAPLPGA